LTIAAEIRGQKSRIRDQRSRIRDQGSEIREQWPVAALRLGWRWRCTDSVGMGEQRGVVAEDEEKGEKCLRRNTRKFGRIGQ
jgi:hypothetical protein